MKTPLFEAKIFRKDGEKFFYLKSRIEDTLRQFLRNGTDEPLTFDDGFNNKAYYIGDKWETLKEVFRLGCNGYYDLPSTGIIQLDAVNIFPLFYVGIENGITIKLPGILPPAKIQAYLFQLSLMARCIEFVAQESAKIQEISE